MILKEKTVSGLFWSAIDSFANHGIQFVIGIILARLLTPREFGLIGMITIFVAVSQTFINSGFSSALIRKKECTQADYSTVFYYNMAMGLILYLILYFSAGAISSFFQEPELKWLVRALGINLIIGSVTLIQDTTIRKRIDFKLLTKIAVISSLISGIIGTVLAFAGFGVWSLVARSLATSFFSSLLVWLWNRWKPILVFSVKSFKELFGFGSKLLASSLIDTVYNNIYYLVIGKYFTAQELGYYTRASGFRDLPSKSLNTIMSRVTYPVLAQMQDNKKLLKAGYKKMIRNIMFISFVLMAGLAAVAEPLVITLIGEKWRQSIVYLQLLCFPGVMYPLHALNLNMLNVQGRSDLFLKLEIVKKIIAVPAIIIGIIWGIKVMILGMWVINIISYYLNSYYSGRFINYPMREQIADIMPSFLVAFLMGITVYLAGLLLPAGYLVKLIVQILLGAVIAFGISEVYKVEAYMDIKNIIKTKLVSVYSSRSFFK